jgi:hypothetical protein
VSGITIVEGSMLISCPPSIAVSKIAPYLKGRSSRLLQEEYEELRKKYWGQHIWARGYFCVSAGSVMKEMREESDSEFPLCRMTLIAVTYCGRAQGTMRAVAVLPCVIPVITLL